MTAVVHKGRNWRLVQADAIDALKALPSDSVDLIITDPAYESLERHRAKGTTTRLKVSDKSSNQWFPIFPNARFLELLEEMYRVMKPNTHAYVFCDDETSDVLRATVAAMGGAAKRPKRFTWWKRIVWDKDAMGMGYHYRNQHEFIVFLEKGKRKLKDLGVPSVLRHKRVVNGYPTEKPYGLCNVLIQQSSEPGELVLDMFCGSSPVGHAAFVGGRSFLGIDVSDRSMEVSRQRLVMAEQAQVRERRFVQA